MLRKAAAALMPASILICGLITEAIEMPLFYVV
jgi:hypothetical protein